MEAARTEGNESSRPVEPHHAVGDALWGETAVVAAASAALVFALTRPAFDAWFFAENFVYFGQYRAHGERFWAAVFGPTLGIFFRPVLVAVSIPWHFVLPLDPFAWHLRNFAFCSLNLLLLHRVLVRLVRSRYARVFAVALFAASKVHLTTIGYVNLLDAPVLLALVLLTVLFVLRFLDAGRGRDWAGALIAYSLAIFSKDYGFAVVVPMAALVAADVAIHGPRRGLLRVWTLRFAPVAAILALYLALRMVVVGAPPVDHPVYTPEVSPSLIARKLFFFTATIGNLAFFRDGSDGAPGLSAWLGGWLPAPYTPERGEVALYLALVGLLAATAWAARHAGWRLLVPTAWIAAYLAPTMLTRNMQIYYYQEPLVGLAIGLSIALERLGPAWRRVWLAVLAVVAVNGALANPALGYHWAFCGSEARRIEGPVLEAHRGERLDAITFVAERVAFWTFTIAGTHGTMLQELMGLPRLAVHVVDRSSSAAHVADASATHLVFDVDAGFTPLSADR